MERRKSVRPEAKPVSAAASEAFRSDPLWYKNNYYAGIEFDRPNDGSLRIWTKDSFKSRDPHNVNAGGDFVTAGAHTAASVSPPTARAF